jgi:MoxR-like ATPase
MSHTKTINQLRDAIAGVFVGKTETIRTLLTGFVSGLHVLIEDVPGVGKTTLARSLAAATGMDFTRIQFTPDLLPGDITGMTIWDQEKKDFVYKPGAIMHQFVLADEINRASPRTQSSLLEAMQDQSVSVDGRTYRLPDPFFVVATQNPSDFIGAFHLPEGELDRFGMALAIGYPMASEEKIILGRFQADEPLARITPILGPADVAEIRSQVRKVTITEALKDFIIQVANKTRGNRFIRLGASPRASLHLQIAAQGYAYIDGRAFVIPEDVMTVAMPVLAHRIILSAEARMENKSAASIVAQILKECEIPTGVRSAAR